MNPQSLSRDKVRQVDQVAIEEFGIPGIVLMENAGRGAAETIHRVAPQGEVVVLCGSGNNGGDGYVVARHLQLLGHSVRIVSLVPAEKLSGDARTNATIARNSGLSITEVDDGEKLKKAIAGATVLVDAMLGTGAKGSPRGLFGEAVSLANASEAQRIALDLPTGLDCDTGQPGEPTFRADHTVSFVAAKQGFANKNADAYVGVVHVAGIGAPRKLLERFGLTD